MILYQSGSSAAHTDPDPGRMCGVAGVKRGPVTLLKLTLTRVSAVLKTGDERVVQWNERFVL